MASVGPLLVPGRSKNARMSGARRCRCCRAGGPVGTPVPGLRGTIDVGEGMDFHRPS